MSETLFFNPYRFGAGVSGLRTVVSWFWCVTGDTDGWTPPSDGSTITTWNDVSGNGRDFTNDSSTGGTYRATYANLNNKPAIEYNGSNQRVKTASAFTAQNQPWTWVVVCSFDGTGNQTVISGDGVNTIGIQSGAWQAQFSTSSTGGTASTGAHLLIGRADGASGSLKVDGSTVIGPTNLGSTTTNTRAVLGGSNVSANFDGAIGFAGCYIGVLSSQNETDIRSLCQSYYGTP